MKKIILFTILLLTCASSFAQKKTNSPAQKESKPATDVQHLKLHPVVADKYVNVYVEFPQPTDITLTLLGSDKNNEKSWEVKAVGSHQQSVDVSALPEGNYTILLIGNTIQEKAEFVVKR